MGHTVRIILTENMPNGKGYKGEVVTVRAGYARNCLIPQKMALYAIPDNFARLGMKDPDLLSKDEIKAGQKAQEEEDEGEDKRAADLLRTYLKNKKLKIWRNADKASGRIHPGLVNAQNVRDKLSKQLKIDLEDHEVVTLGENKVVFTEVDDMDDLVVEAEGIVEEERNVEIKELGEYLAKIHLAGGFTIPLWLSIRAR